MRGLSPTEKLSIVIIAAMASAAFAWATTTQLIVPSMTPVIDVDGITAMLTSIITVDGILFGLVTLPITVYRPAYLDAHVRILYGSALISSGSLVVSILSSLASLGGVHSIEFVNRVTAQGQGTPIQVPYILAAPYVTIPILALVFSFVFVMLTLAAFVVAFPAETK